MFQLKRKNYVKKRQFNHYLKSRNPTAGSPEMEKDLAEGIKNVAKALNKHDVKYMFVGGVAISFYATPRPSANLPKGIEYDIDVWYLATNENFVKLI